MKTITITGSQREQVGKKDARHLKKNGKIPCVLYGGKQQVFFSSDEKRFKQLVYSPDVCTVKLDITGKQYDAVLQEVQFHPVTDKIIHADFLELFEDKKITMHIPVRIVGSSPGMVEGGQLIVKLRRLKIMGLHHKLPDHIDISIDNLNIGGIVKIGDLKVEGLEFIDSPNATIVQIRAPRELVEVAPPVAEVKEGEEAAKEGEEKETKEGAVEGPSAKDAPAPGGKESHKEGKGKTE